MNLSSRWPNESSRGRRRIVPYFLVFAAVAVFSSANIHGAEFYLKPGSAAGNGTKGFPFGSFEAAQKAVCKAVADVSAPSGSVVVTVLDGSYFIDKPVRFTKYDSGTAKHPVVWRAQTRGKVVFSGATALSWRRLDDEM